MKIFTPSLVLIGVALCIMSSCSSKNKLETIGEVKINADPKNALRTEINFQSNKPVTSLVKYWINKDVFSSYPSPIGTNHEVVLVGLKPNSTYKFQIELTGENESGLSEEMEFTTPALPDNLPEIDWKQNSENACTGYFLTQRRFTNGSVYLVDEEGDIVWYQNVPQQPKLAYWTKKSSVLTLCGDPILKNSAGDHILEYDLFGKVLLDLDLTKLDKPLEAHHDVIYNADNNLLILVYEKRVFDFSAKGGLKEQEVLGDAIVMLNAEGKELWKWSVFDHADPLLDTELFSPKNGKFRLLKRSFDDWSHANAISIDNDGNYLVSFKNWDQIWKINSGTGEVMWKLGKNGNIEMSPEGYFSGQHSIHVNKRGEYMLFDNGKEKRSSRILSFEIDEMAKTANLKLNVQLQRDFFADRMGSAYLMPNDNFLVCVPSANSVIVTDESGNVLVNANLGLPDPYRAEFVQMLYPSHREQK